MVLERSEVETEIITERVEEEDDGLPEMRGKEYRRHKGTLH